MRENPVIARSVATWQSRRRLAFRETPEHLQGHLDCRGHKAFAMTRQVLSWTVV
jgi:hypothetical protein